MGLHCLLWSMSENLEKIKEIKSNEIRRAFDDSIVF